MVIEDMKPKTGRRLIPVPRWEDHRGWPPTGGMRHLIFHADKNGFDKVIRRVGRRVLIDEEAFDQWVDEQNAKQK